MRLEPGTLLAILVMAAVTFACRAGGYVLLRRVHTGPWLRLFLGHLPGAIFVAYVAPLLAAGGPADWTGAVATLLAMIVTRNVALGILAGMAGFALIAWGLRAGSGG